ncbi:MAG TPA: alternative ribosome rescue aminoacyl-tRNA hydrolase ArfB [Gemmatimonadaceae bacterium]|nr:alternative ribosome rescue aminoacyl-tRNA hydrolase ArfB [Gemmatimonadaceae bacterium]
MTGFRGFRNNDLRVNGRISIPRTELETQATRSSGPGGQHVNKTSTRIEVRWNLEASRALSAEEKARAREKLGPRLDADGTLRVSASDSRSQRRNRDVAEARLAEIVRRSLVIPKARRRTTRPQRANEARLESKHRRANVKQARHWRDSD